MIKLISWNVNGLRACCDKGFRDIFTQLDADFFCLQETKMQEGQLDLSFEGYTSYWNFLDISSIGIMQKRKDIPALPSLPSTSLCKLLTVWELTSTTMKDVSLHWRWKNFSW